MLVISTFNQFHLTEQVRMSYWTREGCAQQLTSACCHTNGEADFSWGRQLNVTPAGVHLQQRCMPMLQLRHAAAERTVTTGNN